MLALDLLPVMVNQCQSQNRRGAGSILDPEVSILDPEVNLSNEGNGDNDFFFHRTRNYQNYL